MLTVLIATYFFTELSAPQSTYIGRDETGLILPSSLNVRQKEAVATLWSAPWVRSAEAKVLVPDRGI
jgi:hypothetical protein